LTPSPATFGVSGGNVNVGVTLSGADCTWSASKPPSWVNISNGSGTGSGTLSFTALSNQSSHTSRTDTINISTPSTQATLFVTQAGSECTYSLTKASQAFTSSRGDGTVTVAVQPGCTWTAYNSDPSWVTINNGSPPSGGNGTVNFTVAENDSVSPRTGTLTIAGQTFMVNQSAAGNHAKCTVAPPAAAPAAHEGITELLSDLSFTCD
jgi:hypothetical protein